MQWRAILGWAFAFVVAGAGKALACGAAPEPYRTIVAASPAEASTGFPRDGAAATMPVLLALFWLRRRRNHPASRRAGWTERYKLTASATFALVWFAALRALACGSSLQPYLSIHSIMPADGGTGFPRDGAILIELDAWDTPQSEYSTVEVTVARVDDGAIAAGEVRGWGLGEEHNYLWRPSEPLEANAEYRVDVSVTNEPAADIAAPLTSSTTFTTSDALSPALRLEGELAVALRVGTVQDCSERNDCGGCVDAKRDVPALLADVDLPAVTGGFDAYGYEALLFLDDDGPHIIEPGKPFGFAVSAQTMFDATVPKRISVQVPALGEPYVPCFAFAAQDSIHGLQNAAPLCLDELDVESMLQASDGGTAGPSTDAPDAGGTQAGPRSIGDADITADAGDAQSVHDRDAAASGTASGAPHQSHAAAEQGASGCSVSLRAAPPEIAITTPTLFALLAVRLRRRGR